MGTKTIGLDDEAYDRLHAEKREDESFSDTVKRVTAAVSSDWRRGFGKYADGEPGAEAFAETMDAVRRDHAEGTAASHDETLEAMGVDTSEHYAGDGGSETDGESGAEGETTGGE
jgi:predicted CopG family antitoxin